MAAQHRQRWSSTGGVFFFIILDTFFMWQVSVNLDLGCYFTAFFVVL